MENIKIGIAITTTPERRTVFEHTYSTICNNSIPGSIIYYHIDINKIGVSMSKNKCLEVLYKNDCEHFFLFDDDCFPLIENWYLPYIGSGLWHACWNYNRQIIGKYEKRYAINYPSLQIPAHWEYDKPNGCMLYLSKMAIDVVGGWDTDFKGYGYEHVNLSDRIYNNKITPSRYLDIPNSSHIFALSDCESSFTLQDREMIPSNYELYQQKFYSKEFKPFK